MSKEIPRYTIPEEKQHFLAVKHLHLFLGCRFSSA
jgi:hypothetical protein